MAPPRRRGMTRTKGADTAVARGVVNDVIGALRAQIPLRVSHPLRYRNLVDPLDRHGGVTRARNESITSGCFRSRQRTTGELLVNRCSVSGLTLTTLRFRRQGQRRARSTASMTELKSGPPLSQANAKDLTHWNLPFRQWAQAKCVGRSVRASR
jgi:hypothetical protein